MSPIETHTPTDWRVIEAAVASFETAYHRDGHANAADYCPSPNDPNYLPILSELLRADLEFAWGRGKPKRLDDYRSAFPRLFADRERLGEVAFEEYRLRLANEEAVSPSEYAARFEIDVDDWSARSHVSISGQPRTNAVGISIVAQTLSKAEFALSEDRFPEAGELFLNFHIVRELGRGAFARVYVAEQAELAGRLVVLKVSAQLVQESQTLARLQHTNIVPIYSAHRVGKYHVVCMPYFGGTTLADVLKHLKGRESLPESGESFVSTVNQCRNETVALPSPLPPLDAPARLAAPTSLSKLGKMSHADAVLWIGAELADGLAHAHDRGILHRDLKPANVLLDDDGRPMLLDFNLATERDGKVPKTVGGTPMYMSPEQLETLKNQPATIDARSDVYSLGLMLYELVTGVLPGAPPTSQPVGIRQRVTELLERRRERVVSARSHNRLVSPAVDAILQKCLAPNPTHRYNSAHELRDDLRRQLESRTLQHTPEPSWREQARKFARRNPWVQSAAFLSAMLVVVLVTSAALALSLLRQRDSALRVNREREAIRELSEHQLALANLSLNRRQNQLAIEKATQLLANYGWDARQPHRGETGLTVTTNPELQETLGKFYVSLALAEFAEGTPSSRERALSSIQQATVLYRDRLPMKAKRLQEGILNPDGVRKLIEQTDPDSVLGAVLGRDSRRIITAMASLSPDELRTDEWALLASCHRHVGQHADAVACFTAAIVKHGQPTASLLAGRGAAYLSLKQYARAAADFRASLALEREQADVLIDLALAQRGLKQFREAIPTLEAALKLWPDHTRCHFILADVYEQMENTTLTREHRERGFAQQPGDELSFVSRGMAHLNANRAELAVRDFDAAIAINPNCVEARQNKAAALGDQLNRVAEAVDVLTTLLKAYPDYRPARGGRAVYLARLGKRSEAHADAQRLLSDSPTPFERYQLAGVYALTSRTHGSDSQMALQLLASSLQDRTGLQLIGTDPDLLPVLKDQRLRKLIDAAKELGTYHRGK